MVRPRLGLRRQRERKRRRVMGSLGRIQWRRILRWLLRLTRRRLHRRITCERVVRIARRRRLVWRKLRWPRRRWLALVRRLRRRTLLGRRRSLLGRRTLFRRTLFRRTLEWRPLRRRPQVISRRRSCGRARPGGRRCGLRRALSGG